jgi:hypothetical protein
MNRLRKKSENNPIYNSFKKIHRNIFNEGNQRPLLFYYSFIHMCIHCLGHLSPLPPTPLPPTPKGLFNQNYKSLKRGNKEDIRK